MSDNDTAETNKDVPPWLQPVPETEDEGGLMSSGRAKLIAAGAAVGVVVVFVAAIVFLYRDTPNEAPRHIAADQSPVRERPDDAGGMQVDHQDKEVLQIGDGAPATARARIAPQPEQPVDEIPDRPAETETEQESAATDAIGDLAEAALEEEQADAPMETNTQPAATEPAPQQAAAQSAAPASAGEFRVQLGAYGSEQSAETAWRTIRDRFSAELFSLTPIYVPVQSGDRTLYRLRVGMLETRAEADAVCISLRAQQQACFVVNP